MAVPDINAFCAHLKAEREERGVSLEAISGRTRINIRFLDAIERADFSMLQDVYIRIFVRNYIRCVGLDEKVLMKEFDELRDNGTVEAPADDFEAAVPDTVPVEDVADTVPAVPAFDTETVKKIIPFAIGAILIVVLGYFLVGRMDGGASRVEAPVRDVPVVPSVPAPAPVIPAEPVKTGMLLKLDALQYIWVLVVADGHDTLNSGFLQAGSTVPFKADSTIFVKIGLNESRGSAVGISLNGRDLGEWGAPRTRLTKFTITADGIAPDAVISRIIKPQPADTAAPAPASASPSDSTQ